MNYIFSKAVKDNNDLRESFNQLTRKTFGFDFTNWYAAGHWGDMYLPHVLLDNDKVISNVSVNLMQFDMQGVTKKYIQLGTVMTDSTYRGQGLNREIMERILSEYTNKVDGIYLFGNDSVLNYYPKFGFQPSKEYEYYMYCDNNENILAYTVEKVDITQNAQSERLYNFITAYADDQTTTNQNDALYMSKNLGLFQFWLTSEYKNQIFYLPELKIYIIAELNNSVLYIHQIFGKQQPDFSRLANSFGENVTEIVLGYSPMHKEQFLVREYKEDDCTLFILGEDLKVIERDKLRFPVLSHA